MTDLNEIELSPEQKKIIPARAAQNGKPWQAVLQEALNTEIGPKPVTHERMREILSKVPGSLSGDILDDRGDR